jgi:hypothetical protein
VGQAGIPQAEQGNLSLRLDLTESLAGRQGLIYSRRWGWLRIRRPNA